jgi:phosphopentomutase
MKKDQPDIVFINFGYTDHIAHVSTDINNYHAAIKNADEQMWKLWNAIQADPYYRDSTTVFFTNDHGRHTHDFQNHGDHCEGCEHVMLLVLGPDVKKGVVVDKEALQIDVAPTAAELLGFQTPLATGRVLSEPLIKNRSRWEGSFLNCPLKRANFTLLWHVLSAIARLRGRSIPVTGTAHYDWRSC